jgi:hypothetical protein
VGEFETPLQKHLCQVSQAQLVSQPPENDQQNDIGWELQMVEDSASPLVEDALTTSAMKDLITKGSLPTL